MSITDTESPEVLRRSIADEASLEALLELDPEVVVKEVQLVGVEVAYDGIEQGAERVLAILNHIGPLQNLVSVYMNEDEAVFYDRELDPATNPSS